MICNRLKRLESLAARAKLTCCAVCRDGTYPFVDEQDPAGIVNREPLQGIYPESPYDEAGRCRACGRTAREDARVFLVHSVCA